MFGNVGLFAASICHFQGNVRLAGREGRCWVQNNVLQVKFHRLVLETPTVHGIIVSDVPAN